MQQQIHVPVTLHKSTKFAGASVDHGQPVSCPLTNIHQLMSWKPYDVSDAGQEFLIANVPHIPKLIERGSPRTLVCHDMKGGYLADRYVQGIHNDTCFSMMYWNMVDIFVYFSHYFITIPPVTWVNACHRNGVTILGTFITESVNGYNLCKNFLKDEVTWKKLADQMVEIAKFYCFDGWLINIENRVENVKALTDFVEYLTKSMHKVDSHALVLWYDAVTVSGTLKWQNELNQFNRCFYDVCDGIFLNYTWTKNNLIASKQAARCASDVFVGVDVFGRGCYGGGGFNTVMALEIIRKYGLSAAVFAPGWVFEHLDCCNFEENNERFWKLLQPFCSVYPLNCADGLVSCFNPGCNYQQKWVSLSCQDVMPILPQSDIMVYPGDITSRKGSCVLKIPFDTEMIYLYKLQMEAPNGKATIVSPSNSELCFVLLTNKGVLEPTSSLQLSPPHQDYMISHFISDSSFCVNKIAVKVNGHSKKPIFKEQKKTQVKIDFLGLFPLLILKENIKIVSSSISCVDCDWQLSDKENTLLFGGTLRFDIASKITTSTKILCKIQLFETEIEQVIGVAYNRLYRINDLKLPKPDLSGVNGVVTFVAIHMCGLGMKIGESSLKMTYSL